ncbi:hypothetical protein THAOC_19702, partial [Thalassiosira oceanica]
KRDAGSRLKSPHKPSRYSPPEKKRQGARSDDMTVSIDGALDFEMPAPMKLGEMSQESDSDMDLEELATLIEPNDLTGIDRNDSTEKWMESESGKSMANKSKKKPPKKQNKSMSSEPEISVTVEDLGVSLDIDINEDWDLGDIWNVMNLVDPESFEANEKETLKMIRKADRVCMPRELGDWITVKVKGGVRKGGGEMGRGVCEMQLQPLQL